MITSNSSGSSPCSVASTAMDSPLLYEQFGDHQQHQQLISHKTSPTSRQQQQRSGNSSAGRQQQIDLGRGLAPIRIPSSGAVFGNGHQQQQQQQQQHLVALQQQQQHSDASVYSELADINTPEISLDLQNWIECETLLDLPRNSNNNNSSYMTQFVRQSSQQQQYMPHHHQQQQQQQQQHHQLYGVVKEEPLDQHQVQHYSGGGCYAGGYPSTSNGLSSAMENGGPGSVKSVSSSSMDGCSSIGSKRPSAGGSGGSGKRADKGTDEYRRRRERNNIAVRKSREKAKLRSRETEEKVKLLVRDNDRLQKRVQQLTDELAVLHALFAGQQQNGVQHTIPESVQREVAKHLNQQRY